MGAFPILSRFQYDCHIKVVETEPESTIDQLAAACAVHSIGLHVKDQPGRRLRVRPTTEDDSAAPWPGTMSVAEAGIGQYDSLDIYFEDPEA